jgi:cell division protein FtsB
MARAELIRSWLRRTGRIMATVCVGLLAVLIGYKVVFGANGTVEWRAKRVEYQHLQQEIQKATIEHQELEIRVKKLQSDPNTIVKEAREKLGYVMPGEVVLVQPQTRPEVRNAAVAESFPAPVTKR